MRASKYSFGLIELNYLGHIISPKGVQLDSKKIEAVKSWRPSKTMRQVRAFLGLTGYYRHFIKCYTHLVAPLMDLLKKDNFRWEENQQTAFDDLKEKLITTSVLAYPNFSILSVIETDACDVGAGAVLQNEHPISNFSKKISSLGQ